MNQESFENRKKIILDIVGSKEYKPMKIKELAIILNVKKALKRRKQTGPPKADCQSNPVL